MHFIARLIVCLIFTNVVMIQSECQYERNLKAKELNRLLGNVRFQTNTINAIVRFFRQCEQNPCLMTVKKEKSVDLLWKDYMKSFMDLHDKLLAYDCKDIDWQVLDHNNMKFSLEMRRAIISYKARQCSRPCIENYLDNEDVTG